MKKNEYQEVICAFAKNLKKNRLSKKISQEELALLTGLDRTYISKIERQKANPSLKTICLIAQELDISFLQLFSKGE